MEELWPFNEEIVARSIFKSKIPVISAIGHETDYTIADFVADLRAPTPSAAAELVMPEKLALKSRINELTLRLVNSLLSNIRQKRDWLYKVMDSAAFRQPYDKIYQERMKLDILSKDLRKSMLSRYDRERSKLCLLIGKLDALSPLNILSRGYCIIKSENTGNIVKSVNDVDVGNNLEIQLKDGRLYCVVNDKSS